LGWIAIAPDKFGRSQWVDATLARTYSQGAQQLNNLGLARATPDVEASNPVIGSGGLRHVQLGLKLVWYPDSSDQPSSTRVNPGDRL
jgi:hypothetical protein